MRARSCVWRVVNSLESQTGPSFQQAQGRRSAFCADVMACRAFQHEEAHSEALVFGGQPSKDLWQTLAGSLLLNVVRNHLAALEGHTSRLDAIMRRLRRQLRERQYDTWIATMLGRIPASARSSVSRHYRLMLLLYRQPQQPERLEFLRSLGPNSPYNFYMRRAEFTLAQHLIRNWRVPQQHTTWLLQAIQEARPGEDFNSLHLLLQFFDPEAFSDFLESIEVPDDRSEEDEQPSDINP